MRIVLVAIGLVILLAVGWVLKGLMSDRDERDFAVHYSWIVKWALTLSRETQRAPGGASFDSPRIEVAGHPNRWVVSGNVNWRDAGGNPVREPYTAIVENVCKAYADADCWELQGFAMGEPAIDLAEAALAGAAEGTVAQAPAAAQQSASPPAPAPTPAPDQQADQEPEPDAVLALLEEGGPSTPEGAVPDAPPLPMADGIPLPERKPAGPPGSTAEDAAFALADVGELPDAEDSLAAIADTAQPAASEADIGAAIADAGVLGSETGGASQEAGASALPEAQAVEPVETADAAPAAPVEEEPITAEPAGGEPAGETELTIEEPESTPTETADLGAPASIEPAPPQQPAPAAPAQAAPAEPAPAEADVAAAPAEPVTEVAEAEPEAQVAALPPQAGAAQPASLPEEDAAPAGALPAQPGAAAQPGIDAALVVLLQDRLDRAGYDPGPVDGRLGGRTQSALREFERDAGLPVTGQPSRTALAALEELLATRNAAPQPEPKPQVAALPPTPPLPPQQPAQQPAAAAPALPAPASAPAVAPAPPVAPAAPPTTAARSVGAPAEPANLIQPAPAAVPSADESLIFLIQHRLRQAGFSPGRFDGRMNEGTANAIRQYQSRNGLAVDGVPSRALLEQLEGDVLGGEGRQPAAPTPLGAVPCEAVGECAVLPG